ncbi:hypothetical protein B296_00057447 [Ensete ventricosum]|uniref:Uncharacterized protein n=1 Tax=Ensete ventricosum TaxID=4639 RepID=A0A426XJ09_ENSVE|nr:hypothetical protein B296_00057447 [Ensete ventricosum]
MLLVALAESSMAENSKLFAMGVASPYSLALGLAESSIAENSKLFAMGVASPCGQGSWPHEGPWRLGFPDH